ncbi:hypothetical protein [Streptomyces ardesiacus]|uniref:hypothetical protein n=1 Tax=Streptomyces ardesiacus TaxID=285564 RepID=UPI001F316629|nr:hypothetical protein [Streptomyces sp. NBRC 110030]
MLVAHGPDCYAPALLWAPGNRWLLWGWSWEARDEAWAVADGWAGVLTLPREIHVDDNGHTAPAARRRTPDVGKSADAPRRRVGISPRLQRSDRWPLGDITLALPLWQAGRAPVGAR